MIHSDSQCYSDIINTYFSTVACFYMTEILLKLRQTIDKCVVKCHEIITCIRYQENKLTVYLNVHLLLSDFHPFLSPFLTFFLLFSLISFPVPLSLPPYHFFPSHLSFSFLLSHYLFLPSFLLTPSLFPPHSFTFQAKIYLQHRHLLGDQNLEKKKLYFEAILETSVV